MLHPDTIPFLQDLMENNNRDWFQENKTRWEAVKATFLEFTQTCIDAMVPLDPSLGMPQANRCMYRIYRDVRFSNDKSPYKSHLSFFIPTGGVKRTGVPGYYIQFDPADKGNCFIGGGIFMPEPDALAAIRQEIYYNPEEFHAIVEDNEFKKWFPTGLWDFQKLKTAPKGYPKDWADIDFLRHKHYCTMHAIDMDLINSKNLVDYTLECFRASLPLNQFIQKAMYELL